MIPAPIRTAITVAALCLAPLGLQAQAARTAAPPARPPAPPAATPAKTTPAPASAHSGHAGTAPTTGPAAPTAAAAGPARDARGRFVSKKPDISATCADGTTWTGKTRSGACARRGGVKRWN